MMSSSTRYWSYSFILAYMLFIGFVSLYPFHFQFDGVNIARQLARVDWIPFFLPHSHAPRSDVLVNVLLYIPLGVLLAVPLHRREVHAVYPPWLMALLAGGLLSLVIESVQLLTTTRHPSVSDLVTNLAGTVLGSEGFFFLKRNLPAGFIHWLRERIDQAEFRFLSLLALGLLVIQWFPYQFVLSIQMMMHKLQGVVAPGFWKQKILDGSALLMLFAGVVAGGYLVRLLPGERGKFRVVPVYWLWVLVSLAYLLFLEMGQLFIPSRQPHLADFLFFALGHAIAGLLYPYFKWKKIPTVVQAGFSSSNRSVFLEWQWLQTLFGLYLLGICLQVGLWMLTLEIGPARQANKASFFPILAAPFNIAGLLIPIGFFFGALWHQLQGDGNRKSQVMSFFSFGLLVSAVGLILGSNGYFWTFPFLSGILIGFFLYVVHRAVFHLADS